MHENQNDTVLQSVQRYVILVIPLLAKIVRLTSTVTPLAMQAIDVSLWSSLI